jgi:hypothetical protein
MPRYVILRHTGTEEDHYDFMLEREGTLKTWRLNSLDWPQEGIESADHRLMYLDYEGPVSGRRGDVRRVEQGTYEEARWDRDAIQVSLRGGSGARELRFERLPDGRWRITPAAPGRGSQSPRHG